MMRFAMRAIRRLLTSGANVATIKVNGKTYVGNNVTVVNGVVTVDGVQQDGKLSGVVEIRVVEGILGSLSSDAAVSCGRVHGNVVAGGSVQSGDIGGSVDCNGSATCGDVGGSVKCGGSFTGGDVAGDVNAGGSVRHSRS